MDLGLRGKVAIVTGGSEGIGKAIAARLVAEGANVAICARRPDVLAQAAVEIREQGPGQVVPVQADVTRPEDIERVVRTTLETFGRIDILVNNAGRSNAHPFEAVDDATWQEDLDLKLMAWVRFTRLVVPEMRRNGGGRIINIAMVGGKAPGPRSVPTTVSRAAGIALTKALSKELAADRILVNAVCVGLIKSGQMRRRWERNFADKMTLDGWYAQLGKDIPLGRVGEAEEVADLVAFLASERASYITGAAINCDGGLSPIV